MARVSLSLLVLKTRQLERLRDFYGTMGIQFADEQHGSGPVHHAGQLGDTVIEVYPLNDDVAAADATMRLGFTVEKLNEVFIALKALGTPVVTEPKATERGYRAVVLDPDGRSVELHQEGPLD